jgi:hypothetical protein
VLGLLRVTPLKIERRKGWSFGEYVDVVLGLMFVAFGLAILWQMNMKPGIADGMEGIIVFFAVWVAPVKYFALYFLYACHSFASLVPYCRRKFFANEEFDDPFLCSIYLGPTAWRDFLVFFRTGRREAAMLTTAIACAKAFFSKTSAAVYLILASSIFLITQRSILSAGQAFGFILIIFVLAIPLCSTISFPFFLINSLRLRKPTDNQVRREFSSITKSESPYDAFSRYVAYSLQHQKLRCVSILVTAIIIVIILIAFIVGSGPQSAARVMIPSGARALSDVRHRVTHGICDATVKNLTMIQIGYLEQIAETKPNSSEFNATLAVLPAVFGWANLSDLEFIDTPFPDGKLGADVRHLYIRNRRLHVFAISGTKSFVDILVNIELWTSSALVSIFQPLIPLLSAFTHLGRDYKSKLMALPRGIFRPLSLGEFYIGRIREYIDSIEIGDDEDALLTGHSLGGGIAKAIALTTKLAVVGWSGPGTTRLEGILGGTETRPNVVSVSPEQDWAAQIDPSDGTTFKLPCRAGFRNCHDLRRTLCQTAAMCGIFDTTRARCELWFPPNAIQDMLDLAKPKYTR